MRLVWATLTAGLAMATARQTQSKKTQRTRVDCSDILPSLVVEPHNVTSIVPNYKVCRFFVLRNFLEKELLHELHEAAVAFLQSPPKGYALPGLLPGRMAWTLPFEQL